MNKEIIKQDLIGLFAKLCPEVEITEKEINSIKDVVFEKGTSYEYARNFVLNKAFASAITEIYRKISDNVL